jgi:hypothetical protein
MTPRHSIDVITPALWMSGIWLGLAVCVLIATGCGASNAASAGSSEPITKAQAVAFARAVNLQASDLRGAKAFTQGNSAEAISHVEGFSCGHKVSSPPLGGGASELTDNRYGFVGSVVVLTPTEALAKAKLAALSSQRGRACLARTLGESETVEAEKKVTSFAVKVTFVPVTKLLGPGAIALHVVAKLPVYGELAESVPRALKRKLPKPKATFINVDATFFRVGPAEILLLTFGPRQFPLATEHRLLSLLHSRAEAHKLS